ncbi:MAG: cytochrome c [Bacteroidia bacterium]|nr:cytochrome c [Bacteroidia bacterium]
MRFTVKIGILLFLVCSFVMYSFHLYTSNHSLKKTALLGDAALEGKIIWQQNNCQSCHQFYGLGGYLGPDLTNVYSTKDNGTGYIGIMIKNGTKTMPAFKMTETEIEKVTEFLRCMDQSGKADPRNFKATVSGDIKCKDE